MTAAAGGRSRRSEAGRRHPLFAPDTPEEDVQAVLACLGEGWLTMGPRTQAFEAALGEELGAEHVVCVSSGTAALHLSLLAAGVGPGDEVVVPSMSFVAAVAAVRHCGAEPVLCDIRSPTAPALDAERVEAVLGPRTRAVVAVHLWGQPAGLGDLRSLCEERDIALIEDATGAIGARTDAGGAPAGTVGALGCLSFSAERQLCVGEGGAVLTADPELAAKVRSLRSHAMTSVTWDRHRGYAQSYDVVDVGFNFRMDEPRAALGLSRLPRLARELELRREVALRYRSRLGGIPGLELPWDANADERGSHLAFPVLAEDRAARDALRERLAAVGVQTAWHPAVHELSEYARPGLELPASEQFAARHLCLPARPDLAEADREAICEAVLAGAGG